MEAMRPRPSSEKQASAAAREAAEKDLAEQLADLESSRAEIRKVISALEDEIDHGVDHRPAPTLATEPAAVDDLFVLVGHRSPVQHDILTV